MRSTLFVERTDCVSEPCVILRRFREKFSSGDPAKADHDFQPSFRGRRWWLKTFHQEPACEEEHQRPRVPTTEDPHGILKVKLRKTVKSETTLRPAHTTNCCWRRTEHLNERPAAQPKYASRVRCDVCVRDVLRPPLQLDELPFVFKVKKNHDDGRYLEL